ncbi:hypothetical protein [Maribellus mangrovi]|uniref:hypothetical protein n=1 Tax=Maribellus mangrovi TaxID=3133146 RepID=UPI0030EEE745
MFSYFKNGITDTECKKTIDITELVKLIEDNPQKKTITRIRALREKGDDYKEVKESLSYITPNCILSRRKLEDESFQENFKSFSGYIYIDLDVPISKTREYKDYFIKKFGHMVALVCFSSSMGGISVLFKIENEITRENHQLYWYYLKEYVLKGEPVDDKSKGIGRAMFISQDSDVFFNPTNSIYLEIDEKCVEQYKSWCNTNTSNIILDYAHSIIDIKEVLKSIKTSTSIKVKNPVLDLYPVDFASSYFPNKIKDGTKHKLYPVMIHILVYLNPVLPVEFIYSYLYFINQHFACPGMESKEFDRLFNFTYNITQREDYYFRLIRTKYLHFNPDSNLTGDEKRNIANKLNGKRKVNSSIEKIIEAKKQLKSEGKKITKAAVARMTGLSRKTVIEHFEKDELTDIQKEVHDINERFDSDSFSEIYMSPRIAGIAPDGRSQSKLNSTLKKQSDSPEGFNIDLDKIRERHYRKTG